MTRALAGYEPSYRSTYQRSWFPAHNPGILATSTETTAAQPSGGLLWNIAPIARANCTQAAVLSTLRPAAHRISSYDQRSAPGETRWLANALHVVLERPGRRY